MFVRIAKPEEYLRAKLIQTIAFEWSYDPKEKTSEIRMPDNENMWICGEDDELFACIEQLKYSVRFDGRTVRMGGVGGVATLPQYRRKGAIRACMSACLQNMFSQGDVFSALYPFSRSYYKKFGYADGAFLNRWTLPLNALKLPEAGGCMEIVMPGDDLEPVRRIYDEVTRHWNLSDTEAEYFNELKDGAWMKNCHYLYLWRDERDCPAGLILFSKKGRTMDCLSSFEMANALMFRDVRALSALLNFARGFAADYDDIQFITPGSVCVDGLVGEGNHIRCERIYDGMVRVVNVRRALELCRCRGEGRVKIGVKDEILFANNGVWQVDFSETGENTVRKASGTPDAEMTVGALSQLVLGIRGAQDIPMMVDVRVLNPDAPLEKIFYPKTCRLTDWF